MQFLQQNDLCRRTLHEKLISKRKKQKKRGRFYCPTCLEVGGFVVVFPIQRALRLRRRGRARAKPVSQLHTDAGIVSLNNSGFYLVAPKENRSKHRSCQPFYCWVQLGGARRLSPSWPTCRGNAAIVPFNHVVLSLFLSWVAVGCPLSWTLPLPPPPSSSSPAAFPPCPPVFPLFCFFLAPPPPPPIPALVRLRRP